MPGATAPVTLAGALAQFAAETLAGIVIHQLEGPGSPVISGGGILPMDMRTGSISYGGPEYMLICLAEVDYLRDIGIPSWSGSGCSDSHTVDAQAAAEAGMNILASALTGTSFTHNLGYLSAGKTGSLEMLVLCDELAGMARRFASGMRVSEETLAFPVIAECGKNGEYLASEHTLRHFRTEMWVPSLFQRSALNPWIDSGSKPTRERIREKIRALLGE
jgi:trimethylamine--corrinoid protein Co-methyltransferase